jgi:uncharacterized protein (TIGR03032 family)
MPPSAPNAASPPHIQLRVHGDFVAWLAAAGGTLAVTTYNSGKLAMYSAPAGQLESRLWRLARPMGLAYDRGRLAVATRDEICEWTLNQAPATNLTAPAESPLPAQVLEFDGTHATGRLDVHEVAYDAQGLCFANTRFNCLARPSSRANFRRTWTPAFLGASERTDCCHLNGLGVRKGRVAMVSAFCTGATPGSWRAAGRLQSGVVIDVLRQRVAVGGLCMPHSPRWDGQRWWLCNSGEGALCTFDPRSGAFNAVAALPGFTRGLCFVADRAVVGVSRIRKRHILDAPPVRARFSKLHSGVWLINPATGRTTGALEFVRGGREVFDVAFLPALNYVEVRSNAIA